MALTNEQFELLKQSLQAQKASSSPEVAPKQKTTLGQKVLNAGTSVANFVGAKGISEQFGADIARAKAPQDQKSLVEYPKMKNVVGSALQTGANLLPGAGKGASLAVKTAVGAGTGYAFDVGTKMQDNSQKRSVGQTLTPGIGTAIGATVPLAGNALGKVGSKVKANLQEKSTNKVLDAITPKTSEMKPKEFERFLRQGKIAPRIGRAHV